MPLLLGTYGGDFTTSAQLPRHTEVRNEPERQQRLVLQETNYNFYSSRSCVSQVGDLSFVVPEKLNLVSTEQYVSLNGVSNTPLRARITEPVVVSVGGSSCSTSLVVVQPRGPALLGVDVLVKTGLLELDEAGMRLNIPALYTEVEPPKQVRKHVVSGVDETKSDEELLTCSPDLGVARSSTRVASKSKDDLTRQDYVHYHPPPKPS
ncbi:hypothetical protein GNI_038510 [Gregarina niphandrodes]|uniref:Uncharacterized protein n=1 Tax=Gregarina niphandrodes TaxID=110365 RepID=A0A023BAI8_GRENI|nr:hypothetical protein GNI_038510 [Gregarina niphandrodes]EZG78292.1 hypothetical protein GNI_038510 [Gregarina niphandrodes]|eukprot:XP_011129361.1 hypothetical protein GNI_038510 [Gregarina niphandrodes]